MLVTDSPPHRQAVGQVTGAGADVENPVAGLNGERLHQSPDDRRAQHALAVPDRYLPVGVGAVPEGGGNVVVPRYGGKRVEYVQVGDVPGTDLLFHHLAANGFSVDHDTACIALVVMDNLSGIRRLAGDGNAP